MPARWFPAWVRACACLLLSAGCSPGLENERDREALEAYREANGRFSSEDFAGAVALYEQALAVRPRMAAAYERLWRCHGSLGDEASAMAALERGVQVCGLNAIVAVPLAREYARLGLRDEALEIYSALAPARQELRAEMEALRGR